MDELEEFSIPLNLLPISKMEREVPSHQESPPAPLSVLRLGRGTHSMGVVVESLLDLLLSFYEEDERRRSHLMELIWESLIKVIPYSSSLKSPALLQLRGQYQIVFKKLIQVSQKKLGFHPSSGPPLPLGHALNSSDFSHLSRYASEFEELKYIAKGGFGSVFRVRNKLDHFEYAIKKIRLRVEEDWGKFSEVTKEVIMLAKLSHPNIVSYKTAWIEPGSIFRREVEREDTEEEESSFSEQPLSGSQSIQFLEMSSEEKQQPQQNYSYVESSSSSSRDLLPSSSSSNLCMGAILYLQMELCESTLREWMDTPGSNGHLLTDSKVNTHIFTQILEGVSYIHSQGIVHRDLKPRNIFIRKGDNRVQIGDFGLAKEEIQSKVVPPESPLENSLFKYKNTSACVGTQAYASPEQLSYGWVDYKSDIYSLGIILCELFSNFKTGMERSIAISNLKDKSLLDPLLERKFPQIAQYVLWLTNPSPHSRPSAKELLDSEFSKVGQLRLSLLTENIILKESLETRNRELQDCRDELAKRDKEIDFLKKQLLDNK